MNKQKFKQNKFDVTLLTVCSAIPILSGVSASAKSSRHFTRASLQDTPNLRVGLAYRNPSNNKFNGLLAYEYRQNPLTIPTTILTGTGNGSIEHLFSAEAIYAPNWCWELCGKYAFRNATNYFANNFTNTDALHLGQLRASYKLGYHTDVAVEGRQLDQLTKGFNKFGIALEVSHYNYL